VLLLAEQAEQVNLDWQDNQVLLVLLVLLVPVD
jgi:hypothetical protein